MDFVTGFGIFVDIFKVVSPRTGEEITDGTVGHPDGGVLVFSHRHILPEVVDKWGLRYIKKNERRDKSGSV